MKIGVIRFPGTNCDRDVARAIELAGLTPEYIWWNQEDLTDFDGIVIPGGFSYGDSVRLSESTQAKVDAEVKKLVDEGYRKAETILRSNRKALDKVVNTLMKIETLEQEDFEKLVGKPKATFEKPKK